jgi:hypothetical protein
LQILCIFTLLRPLLKLLTLIKQSPKQFTHTYSNILGINSKNMQTKFTETTVLLPKL